jgi:ABC-type multidrug transport system fused ATPase/permease subunit
MKIKNIFHNLANVLDKKSYKNLGIFFISMLFSVVLETISVGAVIPVMSVILDPNIISKHIWLNDLVDLMGIETHEMLVFYSFSALVIIYFAKSCFSVLLIWFQSKFAFELQASISNRLFNRYLHQPYKFYLNRNSSELFRNLTSEIEVFTNNGLMSTLTLLKESLVIIGITILMFLFEPQGTLIMIALASTFILAFNLISKRGSSRWGLERQYFENQRNKHLLQGLGGIKDIKIYGKEIPFIKRYQTNNSHNARINKNQTVVSQLPKVFLEFIVIITLSTVVVVIIKGGRSQMELIQILGLYSVAAFRLMPSINSIMGCIHGLFFAVPAIKTLGNEFSLLNEDAVDLSGLEQNLTYNKNIELKNVSFSYITKGKSILSEVNLFISPKKFIGIVGQSGSGKSTLIDIILGLHRVESGEVLADGININKNPSLWRKHIGYVPQTIFLTDDTLKNNIAFGENEDEIDEKRLTQAIESSGLSLYINDLPEGLDTIVGERGVNISGGQRQRLGIARALYRNPSILIFDEATSSLDIETETLVMETINDLLGKKTIIMVTHKPSLLSSCDAVYQIKKGQIKKI